MPRVGVGPGSNGDWTGTEQLAGPRVPAEPTTASGQLAKFHAPEIVFGQNALLELGHSAGRLGARRPFLLTDAGVVEAGWAHRACEQLRSVGLHPVVWSDLTPNPKDFEVQAAYDRYVDSGADVIIAVGGGSCVDAAKGVAILSGNGGHILDYEGVDEVVKPIPPLVMVPSTSGTGADVSQFCVVTDTFRETKVTIISRTLVPEISIVDPLLLTTMPEWLNAATGLDALAHAVESYVSRAHNPLTDHHALHAVSLVTENLLRTLVDPQNMQARTAMAQGSLEAGMAFTNAILGATHAMSHQVGGLLDAPHGMINAILLPHVIRFNAAEDPVRYGPLARAAGIDIDRVRADQAAELLADRVRELADSLGVPRGLRGLGVGEHNVASLARTTMRDACLTTNPRTMDQQQAVALFRAAM
ncbi:MAG: iron-containing alcohol dehydrogenase [Saccharopolyspora sp.]|uniref:iron-containing alcohol dehydrogenase n=1 Tax=Saccharopolyspora sp. TaxID=33915 RepID=UPI0025FC2DF3|nr:iron-containing alcohol dehydrogenase [Saccharopolyspora sp.]MBQ6644244.1 iron-containing alcohol dehydrogenase [Saccharopolyspora sp.]